MYKNMICEECHTIIEDVTSHSIVVVQQYVHITKGYSYAYCTGGQLWQGQNVQHFCCTPECMLKQVRTCLNEHEQILTPVSTNEVRLHLIVFDAALHCKVCQQALTTEAYRYCLDYATPISHMINDGDTDLGEWCCSLEHAKELALQTLLQLEK